MEGDSDDFRMDDSDGFSDNDDDDDPDVPRCGVTLAQLKTRIKEEIVENGEEALANGTIPGVLKEEQVRKDLTNSEGEGDDEDDDDDLGGVDDDDSKDDEDEEQQDELEFKVANFLADTSVSRRGSKKCKKRLNQICMQIQVQSVFGTFPIQIHFDVSYEVRVWDRSHHCGVEGCSQFAGPLQHL
uniref:Uncharacterized protein n=1 Tax=Lygus hesperus TaxID=30085 RepID=A0A146L8W5_LYGHE